MIKSKLLKKKKKNKNKQSKDCLLSFYSRYNLTPWTIKATPIRIAAKSGWPIESPPRAKDIIPKIIMNIEAIFDICESEIRPTIPAKISIIPMT